MKIEEVVKKYQESYLEGKSQEERDKFFAKDIKRQYGNIQAWRRRFVTKAQREVVPIENILNEIKCANLHVGNLKEISDKEYDKLKKEVAKLQEVVDNFNEIHRQHQIEALLRKRDEIDNQIDKLNNK